MVERWKQEWMASPRYARISRIDSTMPSRGYRKMISKMSWAQASIIMQFRTSHVLLHKYLHRVNKASSPICPTYKEEEESVHHYLFNCTTWHHERWFMGQELGSQAKSADCVLNTRKGAKALLAFVGRTERFKAIYGEVPQLD